MYNYYAVPAFGFSWHQPNYLCTSQIISAPA